VTQSEGGILVSLVGIFTVWIASTDALLGYLRPQMRPWLLTAGAVLVLVGLATAIAGRRAGERTRLRVGWLLLVPLGVHAVLNPGPLATYAAAQQSTPRMITVGNLDLEAHLHAGSFGGQSPELRMVDFFAASRSADDRELLGEQSIRLTGFVGEPLAGSHQFMLTRFVIGCCAGDATALEVAVRGLRGPAPRADTWVRVEGTFDGLWRPSRDQDFRVPSLAGTRLERVDEPSEPYEYP